MASMSAVEVLNALERRGSGLNLSHLKEWAFTGRVMVDALAYKSGSDQTVLDGAGFLDKIKSVNPFVWALDIKGLTWDFGTWASTLVGFLMAVLSGKGFKDVNEKASQDQQRIRYLRYQA